MASIIIQSNVGSDYDIVEKGQVANTYKIPVSTKVIQANIGNDYNATEKGQAANSYRIPVATKIIQISVSYSDIVEYSQRTIQNQ